jgi:hypothetical protein
MYIPPPRPPLFPLESSFVLHYSIKTSFDVSNLAVLLRIMYIAPPSFSLYTQFVKLVSSNINDPLSPISAYIAAPPLLLISPLH